jgi:hypothetical protein
MSEETVRTVVDYASVSLTTAAGSGPDQTNLVIQTHMPMDWSESEMDWFLDKLSARLARQRIVGDIPKHQGDIKHCKKAINNIESDIARLDSNQQIDWDKSGRSGTVKLSAANQKAREDTALTLKQWKERLVDSERLLAEAYQLLNEQSGKAAKTA